MGTTRSPPWRGEGAGVILCGPLEIESPAMSHLILPQPDRAVIARRDSIVADLKRLVGAAAIIADEVGRRAYETDALTAYRRLPLAGGRPPAAAAAAAVC